MAKQGEIDDASDLVELYYFEVAAAWAEELRREWMDATYPANDDAVGWAEPAMPAVLD